MTGNMPAKVEEVDTSGIMIRLNAEESLRLAGSSAQSFTRPQSTPYRRRKALRRHLRN